MGLGRIHSVKTHNGHEDHNTGRVQWGTWRVQDNLLSYEDELDELFIQLGESKPRHSCNDDELNEFKDELGESVEDGPEVLVEGEPVEFLLDSMSGVGVVFR